MTVALALGAIAAFFLCLRFFDVVTVARRAVQLSRDAAGVLRSPDASDEVKEAAARRLSIDFLQLFVSITARTAAALLVPGAVILLLGAAGAVDLGDVIRAFESWVVILLSLALFPVMLVRRR